jgi:hypothetical protein
LVAPPQFVMGLLRRGRGHHECLDLGIEDSGDLQCFLVSVRAKKTHHP